MAHEEYRFQITDKDLLTSFRTGNAVFPDVEMWGQRREILRVAFEDFSVGKPNDDFRRADHVTSINGPW
jgi:hypothetical protein